MGIHAGVVKAPYASVLKRDDLYSITPYPTMASPGSIPKMIMQQPLKKQIDIQFIISYKILNVKDFFALSTQFYKFFNYREI